MYPLYWTKTSEEGFSMRYSFEFKLKCIDLYHQGIWPDTPEDVSQKTFHDNNREWVRISEGYGVEALKHKNLDKNWSPEEKLELVSQVISGKSTRDVAFSNGISSGMLRQWVHRYRESGYNGLINKKRGRTFKEPAAMRKSEPKPLTESEREELIRLRAENEYIKAEIEVIKKRIALRQEKEAAQLKAKKQRSSKSSVKKDTD